MIYSTRFPSPTGLRAGNGGRGAVGKAENPTRGAGCMGLILLIIIWLITFASTYFFIAKTWWLPAGASAAAAGIDHHFTTTFILMGIVFVAAQVALGYLVWHYRDRGSSSSKVAYSHGNTTLEIVWTVLTTFLFVGLNLATYTLWAAERFDPAGANAVRVEVTGMQFAWYFRYPGPDGKFGATNPELEDASAGGEAALGLDPKDPASKDDVVTGTLVSPVNGEIEVILRARGPSGLHSKVGLQSGPQSHRPAVLLPGAGRGVCRHVPVAADAHSLDLANGNLATAGRHKAGDVPHAGDHAWHDHGFLRAHDRATGRLRQLFPADSDWCAGHGFPGAEHAFVLDNLPGLRCNDRGFLRRRRRASARLDRLRAAERSAIGGC